MSRIRCFFPQYYCCGNKKCALYNTCSQLTYKYVPLRSNYERFDKKTIEEKKYHTKMYLFYNYLWGDRKEKWKQYYIEHRRKRDKSLHPHEDFASVRINDICNGDCFNCIYDDCILPEDYLKKQYRKNFIKSHPKYYAEYREKNREQIREKSKVYREKNKEQIRERKKAYYEKNKEQILEREKVYREKNRAKRQQEKMSKENNKQ